MWTRATAKRASTSPCRLCRASSARRGARATPPFGRGRPTATMPRSTSARHGRPSPSTASSPARLLAAGRPPRTPMRRPACTSAPASCPSCSASPSASARRATRPRTSFSTRRGRAAGRCTSMRWRRAAGSSSSGSPTRARVMRSQPDILGVELHQRRSAGSPDDLEQSAGPGLHLADRTLCLGQRRALC